MRREPCLWWGSAISRELNMQSTKRTIIYIDGFNLYYRALRQTSYKWLDPLALCRKMARAENQITAVKYYTANVTARPQDPHQPVRQQMYFRALGTVPQVTIIRGNFLVHSVRLPLATPSPNGPRTIEVIKTEEKGSDVNLAAHLVHDAHSGQFDVAIVITSESDLVEPIRIVTQELKRPVGIFYPSKHVGKQLNQVATFVKPIRTQLLAASQFNPILEDDKGTFHKPDSW